MYLCDILFQLLAILLMIIVFIYIYDFINDNNKNNNSMEYFDQKITRSTPEKCGIMCTKVFDCAGFSYENDICYLSKSPILGKPENSVFTSEYKKTLPRCNKISKIDDPVIATDEDYRRNATYVCTPNDTDNIQQFKLIDDNEKIFSKMEDLEKSSIKKYTFEEIEWGKDISLNNNKQLIANPTKNNSLDVMVKYDEEFLGQYMYPHKCSSNISQRDCLLNCLENKQCVGTEWNPIYLKNETDNKDKYHAYNGVCCPKIKISKIIPRRDFFKFGNFYLKQKELKEKVSSDDIYIKIPKQQI